MRGRPALLRVAIPCSALAALAALGAVGASCGGSQAPTGPGVKLAPSIIVPQNLINEIAVFTLEVFPGSGSNTGVTCDPTTGNLTGDTLSPLFPPVSNATSSSSVCGSGYTRCFLLPSLEQSSTPRVFAVTGFADAARTKQLALGCTTVTIDGGDAEPTVSVPIKMVAIPPKQVCGDGILQVPETCDPPSPASAGTGAVCSSSCQTVEELLSSGTGASGSVTITGSPNDKRDPAFLWPLGGDFLAFFSDSSTNAAQTEQVSMRLLDPTLAPTSSLGAVLESSSIYLPHTPNDPTFPPAAEAFNHKQPAAVQSGGLTYVAFADDSSSKFSIVLRAMDGSLNAEQGTACVIGDTSATESGSQTAPAMAVSTLGGSTDFFFIAWQDDGGRIFGRTYTPNASGSCGVLGTQRLLSTPGSTNNSHVSVAGVPKGWVVVWQSGSDVVIRGVGPSGSPAAAAAPIETSGHTASTPTVAAIPASMSSTDVGAFAVAWSDQAAGATTFTIYAQRYDSTGTSLESPTLISESTHGGGEVSPFITANPAVGGSYAVAWVDQGTDTQVRARLLAGTAGSLGSATGSSSGYLTSAIDGTTGEFQVSVAGGRTRVSPTVVAGGGVSGGQPYMAFGWSDTSTTAPFGIIARRFPLPTQ